MKAKVEFSYGDFRIDKLVKNFYQSIIEKGSICIRAIAGCRKKEVSYSQVEILKPASCKDKEAKKSINLNAILVKEITDGLTVKDRILW